MQSIGVLLRKNGGRRPPMATFSHRGRGEEERTSVTNESITGTSRSEIRTALFSPNGFDIDRIDVCDQLTVAKCRGPIMERTSVFRWPSPALVLFDWQP